MFAYRSILNACGASLMTAYAEKFTDVTEEERKIIKDSLIDRIISCYEDALKILGW